MEYRKMGNAGIKLSALSLGAWLTLGGQIGEQTALECMTAAFDAGVNFFDNAEGYAGGQAEIVMGNVIKKAGWKRSDLVLSTKIYWGGDGPNDRGLSMKHILEGMHGALERLQTEYIDLVFCHQPDPDTPIEETVRAMNILINQGKAFYWGTSNWRAPDIRMAYGFARSENLIPPAMEQPRYHMFDRQLFEVEFADLYREIGLGTTIYSPLAGGLLTGKYNDGIPEGSRAFHEDHAWMREHFENEDAKSRIEKVKQLTEEVARPLGCSMAQLALAWCLKNPNVSTVITGASRASQVAENMKALTVAEKLSEDWMAKIESILGNQPAAGEI
jgi:voltage-dependent potassium channel beta subunit